MTARILVHLGPHRFLTTTGNVTWNSLRPFWANIVLWAKNILLIQFVLKINCTTTKTILELMKILASFWVKVANVGSIFDWVTMMDWQLACYWYKLKITKNIMLCILMLITPHFPVHIANWLLKYWEFIMDLFDFEAFPFESSFCDKLK